MVNLPVSSYTCVTNFQTCALFIGPPCTSRQKNWELENVAIANALQVEAARRCTVPICFNTSPMASFKSLSLSVAVLEPIYCWYVTLRFDLELWPRDLDLEPIWPWTFIVYLLWLDETLQILVKSYNPQRSYCDLKFDLMTLNTYHVLRYALR